MNVTSGDIQGGSTITMQAARSAFFTQEQTVRRKLQEAFVTYRLEREFSKEEILALYLNVIFFGQRAYGVAAAAETYFGKQLDKLTLGEAATLARVPQWPSKFNPISNPQGATDRRKYVLRRMQELGFVDAEAAEAASHEVVSARAHRALADVEAPYVAEMVRLEVIKRFGLAGAGRRLQGLHHSRWAAADRRQPGPAHRPHRPRPASRLARRRPTGWSSPAAEAPEALEALLDEYGTAGNLQPAIVTSVAEKQAQVFIKGRGAATIEWARHVVGEAPHQ